jgi:putative membrane protein
VTGCAGVCDDAPVRAGSTEPTSSDANRRTHLANERTYLAWLRSALTSVAVGLGVAKFIPSLHEGTAWPYVSLGIGFCALGLVLAIYGVYRMRRVDRALQTGSFGPFDDRAAVAIGAIAVVLSALTIVVVVFDR